jgi:hypothetical protein
MRDPRQIAKKSPKALMANGDLSDVTGALNKKLDKKENY